MNTTYTQQIEAIRRARLVFKGHSGAEDKIEVDSALNDAMSTIASLNLTKDLPKPADSKNWTEDFSDENGNYQNECIECHQIFLGHKYRRVCKECFKPADQSREEYFETLDTLFGKYFEIMDLDEEQKNRNEILAMSYDRIKELEAKQKAISAAYSQYTDFLYGYRNGSASISEVNAAQSEFLILLNGNDN